MPAEHAVPALRRSLPCPPRPVTLAPVLIALIALIALMGGCAAPAPVEAPSAIEIPPAFREATQWVPAGTALPASGEPWWRVYGDESLDDLQGQAQQTNATLATAKAARDAARAALAASQAALWPTVTAGAATTRRRDTTYSPRTQQFTDTLWSRTQLGLDVRWEPDFWGRLGDDAAAAKARAAGQDAALAGARLGLSAQVAAMYFLVRQIDLDLGLHTQLHDIARQRARMVQADQARGRASNDDVLRAQSEQDEQEMKMALLVRERAVGEHALAALVGRAPADFALPPRASQARPAMAALSPTLPSALLQRRPDLVQALRAVEAAGAEVNATQAAWFPTLELGASAGAEGARLFQLVNLPARVWSVGPALAATLLDGGRRDARLQAAQAARDGAVARYREAVLAAFQEVEDLLATRHRLAERDRAAGALADKAQTLARHKRQQHARGLASRRDELAAQAQAIEAEMNWCDGLYESRHAELMLIKAIGGGWTAVPP